MKKISVAVLLTLIFGKILPLLAVFLLVAGIVVIFAEAVKEGKNL